MQGTCRCRCSRQIPRSPNQLKSWVAFIKIWLSRKSSWRKWNSNPGLCSSSSTSPKCRCGKTCTRAWAYLQQSSTETANPWCTQSDTDCGRGNWRDPFLSLNLLFFWRLGSILASSLQIGSGIINLGPLVEIAFSSPSKRLQSNAWRMQWTSTKLSYLNFYKK